MKNQFKNIWLGQQTWENILFMHFPTTIDSLRPYIPKPLQIDTFNDQAWISVVLFQAKHSRLRGLPMFLSFPPYIQMNVRTYVNIQGKSGVYFFTLFANNYIAASVARTSHLPFYYQKINFSKKMKRYTLEVTDHSISPFILQYQLNSLPTIPEKSPLEEWLVERYHLWFERGNKIIRASIDHQPWSIKQADIFWEKPLKLRLFSPIDETQMITHYASRKTAFIYPFDTECIYIP